MNEKELKILWDFLKKDNPSYMDFPTFKSKMGTPEERRRFFNKNYPALVKKNFFSNDWTPEDFESEYGPQQSSPQPSPQPKKSNFTEVNITPEEVCNGKVVSEGMKGDIVWIIQNKLKVSPLTRNFGSKTKTAVVNFQNTHKDKLTVDGSVGPKTWSIMFEGTQYACKKIDMKPIENKPAEVKPAEVKPKVRKPIKDLDVVSPEKYSVRIGEQLDIKNRNFNPAMPKFNFNDPKYVAPSEPKTDDPEQILKRVINTGCIAALEKELQFKLSGKPESQPKRFSNGAYAIVGTNSETEEIIRLYSNGTGIRFKVDEENKAIANTTENFEWECADFKKTTSLTADDNQMTADQQQFVKDIVASGNGYYRTEMPSGYDEGQGAWKRTDLSTVPGGNQYFKQPNKFFVWARTGIVGKQQDYVQKVVDFIKATGYSFDQPDLTSAAFETGVLLGDKFPKYRDYFKPDQKIWYVGKTYSGKEQGEVGSVVEKIKADDGTALKKEFCKGGVEVLYDAAFNPTKVYFDSDADLQLVKDYVKRCERELRPNAMSNILGGSRKKFEYLKANRSGTKGALRFMLGEQKNNLNSLIKKKLVEAKTKKENDTIGKQLIESRLKMIVDSIKKQGNTIEKKNLEKVSLEFINELKELNNQGLINETLGDSLKGIFGTGLEAMPQTFFEVIFDRVLTKLGLNDSSLKTALVNSAKNNPTEVVNSFKDCDSMTELIAKTITEILYMNLQSEKNLKGQGWNLIRNILGQEIKKEEFLENIKTNLNNSVCQEFSNLTSNSQNLLSKIKGATI